MKKSKSIIFHEFGPPEKVLSLIEEEVPEPRAGEVLIRVEASPINPADLNIIEGKYPKRPQLPCRARNGGRRRHRGHRRGGHPA